MAREFPQIDWDDRLAADWRRLLAIAIEEDLGPDEPDDLTTAAVVPAGVPGQAAVVARRPGVVAGLPTVPITLAAIDPALEFRATVDDGHRVTSGSHVGLLTGPARAILAAERLVLNTLGRLSGIASLTADYVDAVADTEARIYDTRKTTPGWRRLEKYAVRCGGGWNHREALFAAVLIKDNHLALGAQAAGVPDARSFAEPNPLGEPHYTPAEAVRRAREYLVERFGQQRAEEIVVEIEVDTLAQLSAVLIAHPDIVLLDNMDTHTLSTAIETRNQLGAGVELEASGGVTLETVARIAATGVERISVGGLTHSAAQLDLGLDWL